MNTIINKIKSNKKLLIIISSAVVLLSLLALFLCLSFGGFSPFKGSELNIKSMEQISVTDELMITDMGDYTGLYLEDGSDELVAEIMMIVLKNVSDKDLQLARISVEYQNFTAEYEATNIPSGDSVVLLEKSRHKAVTTNYKNITASDVVFFEKPMSLMEGIVAISGDDGSITLTNTSDKSISGVTYVYYKNVAGGTYYGGITYRAKFEETIPSGEASQVLTSHYTKKNSEIIQVVNIE